MPAHTRDSRVAFTGSHAGHGKRTRLLGTVTRVWDKPAADPYITIKSDDGRTFVRCSSAAERI